MRRTALGLTGLALLILGLVLLLDTGAIASALGTPGPIPDAGATSVSAVAFWRVLTFIRMFGTAALGLGAICIWCVWQLTVAQQSSFLWLLAGSMAALAVMALIQQIAVWGTVAGWLLVAGLGAGLLAALAGVAAGRRREPA